MSSSGCCLRYSGRRLLFLMRIPPPPPPTLFPYTTLFRSRKRADESEQRVVVDQAHLGTEVGERRPVDRHGVAHTDDVADRDRKSTRLNSSHRCISYAVFCLKKKKT